MKNLEHQEKPIYYFPDVNVKKPEPKYCEQPIVYLLLYLLQLAGDLKAYKLEKGGNVWKVWNYVTRMDFKNNIG